MNGKIFQNSLNESLNKYRNNIAIEYGNKTVTYAELDERSNLIADWIIAGGIKKQSFIGILMEDRSEIIPVLIGIIKAGCVVVPIYSAYPTERIETMIHTTDLQYIFIDEVNARRFETGNKVFEQVKQFIFAKDIKGEEYRSIEKTGVQYSPEDMFYVHFTSGTTGIPKAVVGKNKSILHFIKWEIETFHIDGSFRVAQFTIPGFDPFLRDIFVPLLAGGVIDIPESEALLRDSEKLAEWVDNRGIGLIHCVASLFRLLTSNPLTPRHFKALKCILLAGEKINPSDLVDWYNTFDERIQLVNCYGPTETTQSKVFYPIKKSDINRERIPIGKPLKGCRIIILDGEMNICDELDVGEIYIRTPYRACGYYNDPGLNKKKFIQNPFSSNPNDILYKSGDLGRVLLDGNIDILGRVDRQVKILGYRIELEEIESVLVEHPSVKEAVVQKKEVSNTNELLCAYIVNSDHNAVEKEDFILALRDYLSEKLPDYMVPAKIVKMDKIPRKVTGKIDYDVLPDPFKEEKGKYIAPRNDIEKRLLTLWVDILGIEKIGINDRFIELGGNSLNIMTLTSAIHREFDVRISLGQIFNNPTIEMQAKIIRDAAKEKYGTIKPAEEKPYYPLSSAQKRMYIAQQVDPESKSYNMPTILVLEGDLDSQKLTDAFKHLVRRHESLRTSFVVVDNEPVQQIHPGMELDVEYHEAHRDDAHQIIADFIKPFDLSRAPLIRVGLIKTGAGEHILMLDTSHIISDGVSYVVLVNDLMAFYNDEELPPLKIQYKDFSEWQRELFESEKIKKQEEYWLERFNGQIPVLDIPTDYSRPRVRDLDAGDLIRFPLDKELCAAVYKLVKETESTIFMVLLAAYNILLSKYASEEDIVVGSPITGRSHADLHSIIGVFLNMVAIRNQPSWDKTFGEFLDEVKRSCLEAFENQDYQFEELVVKLGLQGDAGRNPLFDTEFSMNNMELPEIEIPGLKLKPYGSEIKFAKFDLHFLAIEMDDNTLAVDLRYSIELFERTTIEKMIRHYIEILEQVTEDPDILLKDITSHDLVETKSSVYKEDSSDFDF